jgi:type III secretory pathway component EscR
VNHKLHLLAHLFSLLVVVQEICTSLAFLVVAVVVVAHNNQQVVKQVCSLMDFQVATVTLLVVAVVAVVQEAQEEVRAEQLVAQVA